MTCAQLDRQPFDDKLQQEGQALRERWAGANADVTGLNAQIEQLVIQAPFAGRAVDVNENLIPGTWVALHEKLLHVTGLSDANGEILVREADLSRLSHGAAIFMVDRGGGAGIPCRLGAVRVQPDPAGLLIPVETPFRARLTDCRTGAPPLQELRGPAHLIGTSSSVAGILLRRAIVGLQAELGR